MPEHVELAWEVIQQLSADQTVSGEPMIVQKEIIDRAHDQLVFNVAQYSASSLEHIVDISQKQEALQSMLIPWGIRGQIFTYRCDDR
jgi:hypothetical protein